LFALKGKFYKKFRQTILDKLKQDWIEESPAIYEIVCQIQDEIMPELLE